MLPTHVVAACPVRMNTTTFSHTLQQLHLSLSTAESRQFLQHAISCIQYLAVYQHYFPQEYSHSMELVRTGQASLLPAHGKAYSLHEEVFLKLVDEHLFSLPLWYILEDNEEGERCFFVPIEPFGLDPATGDILEMDLGWQLLYYLVGELSPAFLADALSSDAEEDGKREEDELFALPIERGSVDDEVLQRVCQQQQAPLSFLCHALHMMEYDTQTVWLDATMEMSCDNAVWDIETIDELMLQYREAEAIKEKTNQFLRWLESDITRFKEVIAVWNETVKQTKALPGAQQLNPLNPPILPNS